MEASPLLHFETNRRSALVALAGAAMIAGADRPGPKLASTLPKANDTVGDWALIQAKRTQKVEGVGLVVGLNGTGSDAESGIYRTELLNEMRKANVDSPANILASPNTSMVIVRATIPAGVSPADPLDVTVELTTNSGTTSLVGGYLMRTTLREVMMTGEDVKEGSPLASAYGPIMIGDAAKPDNPKAGRVLGGARVKKEVPFRLVLKEKHKSIRSSAMVQEVINRRFAVKIGPESRGVATAKTDEFLELKIPQVYHQNQARFFQVIKLLSIVDRDDIRAARIAQWRDELKDPKTAGLAALKLEGVGQPAVEALEEGIKSKDLEARFFAAESLAYLQKETGVAVLKEAAQKSEDLRAFALAALAAADQPAAMMALRSLMSAPDPVIRYGAFAALRTADPENAYLGRIPVMKDRSSDEAGDNMAAAIDEIQSRRRRGAGVDDPFELYIVHSDGNPMVHYTRSNRAEIVLFGANQKLETPIVLGGGGSIILNASENDDKVEISRITRNSIDFEKKVVSSLEMKDIIREVANLGATYPEIVELLNAAQKQHNLEGQLLADAKPVTSDKYVQAQLEGKRLSDQPKRDASLRQASAEAVEEEEEERGPLRIFRLPKLRGFGNREQKPEEPAKPSDNVPKEPPYKSLRPYVPFLNSKPSLPRLPME
jgi:flagellar basal body P-ring protein FlgI